MRRIHLDRAALDRMIPGLREQWTGAWYEASCADIEVAAFHAACLAAIRRARRRRCAPTRRCVRRDAIGRRVARSKPAPGRSTRRVLVNAAGAWGDEVARALPGSRRLGLEPRRRTVVQLRVGRARPARPAARHRPPRELLFQGRGRQQRLGLPARRDAGRSVRRRARGNRRRDRDRPIRAGGRLAGRGGRAQMGGPAHLRARPADEVRLRSAGAAASSGASGRAAWASRPRRRRPCCARR